MSDKSKNKSKKAAKPAAKKATVNTPAIADAPDLSGSQDEVLGTLSAEPEPKSDEKPKRSMQKKQDEEKAESSSPTPSVLSAEPEAQRPAEPLHVPRGALIAFRKSGGLKFSSREVVLYPDGRVAYDSRGVASKDYNRLRRVMNDGQMASFRRLLDQTGFWKAETTGQQNPDAFAYEIAARIGQRVNEIEVFDGSIDERLKPLVDQLTKLLPEE